MTVKKAKKLLFIFGIFLALCGFLLEKDIHIPLVSALLDGRVNSTKAGFDKVCGMPIGFEDVSNRYRSIKRGNLKLEPRDRGFKELTDLILADLRKNNSELFAKTWSGSLFFERFKERALSVGFSKMTYQGIPGDGTGINILLGNNRINAFLADSENEYASFFVYKIREQIEKEHRAVTLWWSCPIFILGLVITILQFDWSGESRK